MLIENLRSNCSIAEVRYFGNRINNSIIDEIFVAIYDNFVLRKFGFTMGEECRRKFVRIEDATMNYFKMFLKQVGET